MHILYCTCTVYTCTRTVRVYEIMEPLTCRGNSALLMRTHQSMPAINEPSLNCHLPSSHHSQNQTHLVRVITTS